MCLSITSCAEEPRECSVESEFGQMSRSGELSSGIQAISLLQTATSLVIFKSAFSPTKAQNHKWKYHKLTLMFFQPDSVLNKQQQNISHLSVTNTHPHLWHGFRIHTHMQIMGWSATNTTCIQSKLALAFFLYIYCKISFKKLENLGDINLNIFKDN